MRETGALLAELACAVPDLAREEGRLLRAETVEAAMRMRRGLALILGGAVLATAALNVLAAALVAAIAGAGVAPGQAALIVGGTLALIALGLAMGGAAALKASARAPERTARALRRDVALVKETTR